MKIKDGFSGERSLVLPKVMIDMMENDPLAGLLHITDIGYYPKARHHFRERNPGIDKYVFIYCIDGCGWYEVEGVRYEVSEDHYFILPAGNPILMPHLIRNLGLSTGHTFVAQWPNILCLTRCPLKKWHHRQTHE